MVHTSLDLESALAELPSVFSGDLGVAPSSGLGTNAERAVADRVAPKILFFGAGIPPSEVEQVSAAIKAKAPEAHFVQISPSEIQVAGGHGPDFDVISKVLKEKFAKLA